jgi:ribosomal protein S18 acetylase RimI-like enzyme
MTREVAAKHLEAIVEVYRTTKLESWPDWGPANVMMDLPRKWEFSLLLLDNTTPMGFLIASVCKSDVVYVHHMAVLREFRGLLGGRRLMKRLIQLSNEKGMSAIALETPPGTEAAQKIHVSLGFQVINDEVSLDRYLADRGIVEKKIRWPLRYYPMNEKGTKVWREELRGARP